MQWIKTTMPCPTIQELPPPSTDKTGWPWTEESPAMPERMKNGQPWPRITVVTPSYNQDAFLEETIRSVLLQGYPNLEYMIIDGNSQDHSPEIIKKYAPFLSFWVSEPDRGQSEAINKGWGRATGDLISYLNSDDIYFPGTLRTVAEVWDADPAIALVCGGIAFLYSNSQVRSKRSPLLEGDSPLDLSLLEPYAWFLPQQATFYVREYLDQVGRSLSEELHFTMDRELLYRICRSGKVQLTPEIIAGDRAHGESKRLSQTLQMYREDAVALSYCNWGDGKDYLRRKQVARLRLAQGHFHYANRAPSRLSALWHLTNAAFYRPSYLKRRSFIRGLLRSIGILRPEPNPRTT
jgi:glycosyltransferase involved in cell wall biosynthesis